MNPPVSVGCSNRGTTRYDLRRLLLSSLTEKKKKKVPMVMASPGKPSWPKFFILKIKKQCASPTSSVLLLVGTPGLSASQFWEECDSDREEAEFH